MVPLTGDRAATVTYHERLWPSPGVWVVAALIGLGGGAILWPFGTTAAAAGFIVMTALVVAGLITMSPRISIEQGVLHAGRAQIELELVGTATAYVREQARLQRGPGLDARAFLVIRGWVDPVVKVAICDEADPTPYWLLSTRHPASLVAALSADRG